MVSEMLADGVMLMAMGMGIVFGFLVVLVFALKAMSALAIKLEGEMQPVQTYSATSSSTTTRDDEVVAAISAAVSRYRADRG